MYEKQTEATLNRTRQNSKDLMYTQRTNEARQERNYAQEKEINLTKTNRVYAREPETTTDKDDAQKDKEAQTTLEKINARQTETLKNVDDAQ